MNGEKPEDIVTHGLGMVCRLGFYREEQVDNAAGDEGDEEGTVVNYDILQ